MLKVRWSHDRLIFNMGIPKLGKDGFYIERLMRPLGIPHVFQIPLTVPCTTLKSGNLPAIRVVQGDCERVYGWPGSAASMSTSPGESSYSPQYFSTSNTRAIMAYYSHIRGSQRHWPQFTAPWWRHGIETLSTFFFNSSPPGQNGSLFTDDIFRCVFVNDFFSMLV